MPIGKIPVKRRDRKSNFHALTVYISDAKKTKGNVWLLNCLSIDTAGMEMTATAMQNSRCDSSAFHAVINWPSDQKPTPNQAREAGVIALEQLGFDTKNGGHQSMIGFHQDTDCLHIHIAANKVHPRTLKSLHIEWSYKTLHHACRTIELKQGWSHQLGLKEVVIDVNGNEKIVDSDYRNQRNMGMSQKALDVEKHNGVYSFERYIKDTVGPSLSEALKAGFSWQKVHILLDEFNVSIVERGGGFAFADQPLFKTDFTDVQRSSEVARADKNHSAAGKAGTFARGSNLIKKLGEFEPNKLDRRFPSVRYNANAKLGYEQLDSNGRQVTRQLSQEDKDEGRLKALFGKEMLERKIFFTAKKVKRTVEITDVKKIEERELQDLFNTSRIKAHAANALLLPEFKLLTSDVNTILRTERDKKKQELKKKQIVRQKALDAEFDALEKGLQKHNSYHRWLAEQSKQDDEIGRLAKHFYRLSKMREQFAKNKQQDQGNETFQAPVSKRHLLVAFSISKDLEVRGYKAYDNKTHIAYVKDHKVKFKDYGNTISINDQEDQSIRDAVTLAIEKWGKTIRINGNAGFQANVARMAFELGVEKIQSDDKQALEIFKVLKAGSEPLDLANSVNFELILQ
ncbi:relaxase/mobilization nuclease domain-containing protein [Methylobacter psychrophilus]|uniref:relaxase/mobilization nuclease domain-containing protein n=1 Tax=Methylobacter psychrophilus TaxID=96941 RepID=UPI0021D51BBC|nr:relaxase/mobilization nuclease domain-containing protein [Methylobacter psychrophilus]